MTAAVEPEVRDFVEPIPGGVCQLVHEGGVIDLRRRTPGDPVVGPLIAHAVQNPAVADQWLVVLGPNEHLVNGGKEQAADCLRVFGKQEAAEVWARSQGPGVD